MLDKLPDLEGSKYGERYLRVERGRGLYRGRDRYLQVERSEGGERDRNLKMKKIQIYSDFML